MNKNGQRGSKSLRGSSDVADSVNHESVWRDANWRRRVRRQLLKWFDTNARTLPWRQHPEPYRVWVSEVMLQQTQVATVIPYFERFLKSFPTVQELADAPEEFLLKHWEGLGYYRRARSLHAAAKRIVAEHDGVFPTDFDDVLALPGIGRYTAGAILSISGDQKLPILEGNTQRVFSRWVALREPPTESHPNKLLWQIAEAMLPRTGSGQFNQAAMELGALVCTAREPKCEKCPIQKSCRAHQSGLESEIPGKITKTKYEERTEFALVINAPGQDRYLMRPLPEGGRWAGLWDFPRSTDVTFKSVEGAAAWLSDLVGAKITPGVRLKTIKHAVTKYRIALHVHMSHTANCDSLSLPEPWQFVALPAMNKLPMSVTGRRIADLLQNQTQPVLPLSGGQT